MNRYREAGRNGARAARGRPKVHVSMSSRTLRGLDALAAFWGKSRGDVIEEVLDVLRKDLDFDKDDANELQRAMEWRNDDNEGS